MSPERHERRLLVIYNPIAGMRKGRRFRAVLGRLRAAGAAITLRPTGQRGDAERYAREARRARFDVVVAAGGDGTINEVVNGLGDPDLPLAILPLGTANVLAAEIGLRLSADAIARMILDGRPQPVHPGLVNGRRFLLMAGAGFDARVVARVRPRMKRILGKLVYVWESLAEMLDRRERRYAVTIDGVATEAASVIVAKAHFYGGRYVCAPEARLQDPLFQVCLFARGGRRAALAYAAALALGRLPGRSDYRVVPGRIVTIAGEGGEPVQGDGDSLTILPARIALAPRPLLLVMPP